MVVALLFLFPEGEVLFEELDDALGVTEVVLLKLVDLVESGLESVVGELAGLGVVLQHFVVEDAVVEGESELDGVASGKIDAVGLLVGGLGLLLNFLEEAILRVLSDVAVVVANHLDEEGLGLVGAGATEDTVADHVDDLLAVSAELLLDLSLVLHKCAIELGVLRVRLDGRDGAAGSSLGGDEVLEGDREQVALVGVDLTTLGGKDLLKVVDHILVALGLLGDTSEEYLLFNVNHFLLGC